MMTKSEVKHDDWEWFALGDICEVITGTTPTKLVANNYGGETPFIKPPDILDAPIAVSDTGERLSAYGVQQARVAPPNTVLVTCIGILGRVGLLQVRSAFNQQINAILENDSLEGKFIFYLAQSTMFREQLKSFATGTTIPIINKSNFAKIRVPIPSKLTQRLIVAKLDTLFADLDRAVARLQAAREKIKTYRQSVLKHAFEGKLTHPDVKNGELPEGWKWVNLADISDITGGVTKGKDYGSRKTIDLPYLSVANVQDGYLDLSQVKTIQVPIEEKTKYKLQLGDVLYTEGGDKDKLGRGTVWKNEIENCIHQNHIFRARPNESKVHPEYLAYYSQGVQARNYFYSRGKQTTNLASINLSILKELPVALCALREQEHVIEQIESRLAVCNNIEETITKSLDQTEDLRQSILNQAFEGELVYPEPTI